MKKRKKRKSHTEYGQDYKGSGKLRCASCGEPVADHSLGSYCTSIDPIDMYRS